MYGVPGLVVAVALLLFSAPRASAATFHFQAVLRSVSASCPIACYQIRMFYEDPSRQVEAQVIQMDLDLQGMEFAGLPGGLPPGQRWVVSGANAVLSDFEGNTVTVPWTTGSVVGYSPNPGFDVLTFSTSGIPRSVDSLVRIHEVFSAECSGVCLIQREGLAADRIYLGGFDAIWSGGPVAIRVGNITGAGPGVFDPVDGLSRLEGARFPVDGLPAPEPAGGLTLAASLTGLLAWRMCGARSRGAEGEVRCRE